MGERAVLRAEDWKLALQRAFDGKRNAALDRLGSLDELIRVDIANSADASVSTVELHKALDEILPTWNWRPTAQLRMTAMILDVLRAFQPRLGGPKTVELLHRWRSGSSILEVYPGRSVNVRLLALRVLESDYPTPLDNSREWDAYIRLLYELLARTEQPAYLFTRLREADGNEFQARMQSVIADTPVLTALVNKLIADGSSRYALSFLYGLCIPDRVAEFEHAVEQAGGRMEELVEMAMITVAEKTIAVEPTDAEMLEAIQTASNQFMVRLDMVVPSGGISGNGHERQE